MPLAAHEGSLRKVFGASSHQYKLNEPLAAEAIEAFERKHGIELPEELTDFLTAVGDGGAGPQYGIYRLERMEKESARLAEPCRLRPDFTDDEWRQLEAWCEEQAEEAGDEAYDADGQRMFQGTLCIGTQGCSYDTVLVLNGPYRGRIAYIDRDFQKPFFTYEPNFLDWYERWLDELIAGYKVDSFGNLRPGGEAELLALFDAADDEPTKLEAIRGLSKLPSLQPDTIARLRGIYRQTEPFSPLARLTLNYLAEADYSFAEADLLDELSSGPEAQDRESAAQMIRTHIPVETLRNRIPVFVKRLHEEQDHDVVFLLLMILEKAEGIDFDVLRPLFIHSDAGIRATALHYAGKLPDKARHLSVFRAGLEDSDSGVNRNAMQALEEYGGDTEAWLRDLMLHPDAETRDNAKVLLELWPSDERR
ncbi:SMI1/KNR4 family protein [Saccharibacillus sp. O23]|uniref:SMI1/KNR4 family protein n=1 Tax=Saccharibacillus sp. O23 TaxID=2009338 RepID=UPI0015C5F647|nr:SMI1/KNR4 family protein [Saccharibacillus sp. O23]